jgi:hypothetical protein
VVADALIPVLNENVPDTILDTYANVRRDIFLNLVNPASQANKRRLNETQPDTVGQTGSFLKMLRETNAIEKQKIRGMEGLWVDVRQVWEKEHAEQ